MQRAGVTGQESRNGRWLYDNVTIDPTQRKCTSAAHAPTHSVSRDTRTANSSFFHVCARRLDWTCCARFPFATPRPADGGNVTDDSRHRDHVRTPKTDKRHRHRMHDAARPFRARKSNARTRHESREGSGQEHCGDEVLLSMCIVRGRTARQEAVSRGRR